MARIVGVDIPNDKPVMFSLTYIYGIGRTTARNICEAAKVDPSLRVKDLSDDQMNAIRTEVSKIKVEGDLRREVALNIKRLTEIGCYRGIRHKKGLPVRGQKTKTNARTRKGPRKTIANKKMAPKQRLVERSKLQWLKLFVKRKLNVLTHTIAVESDYDISYEIIRTNPYPVLRWQSHGVLKSLNVGTDKVTISNGYETKTVDVVVDVFTEPTFEFGCAPARIRELYGTKYQGAYVTDHDIQYLRYVYIGDESNNYMYSPTCYHMDFYFQDSQYIVSQVFIRKNNIEIPLKNYIDDNFDSLRTIPKYYYDGVISICRQFSLLFLRTMRCRAACARSARRCTPRRIPSATPAN